MRKFNKILVIITSVWIMGCQQDEAALIERLIQSRINQRVQEYITVEKQRCRDRLIEEASATADSLLRANPVMITLDSLIRPPVPAKPRKPEFVRPSDSIKIAPIIPKINMQNN